MNQRPCPRERDVLRAVASGGPARGGREALAHAGTCARCRQVRGAAEVLKAAWLQDAQAGRVPPAAAMWWRLDRRARADRVRRVQHVTWALQALLLAAVLGAGVAALQVAAPWVAGTGGVLADTWETVTSFTTARSEASAARMVALALLVGAWLLLVPAALVLGLRDDEG